MVGRKQEIKTLDDRLLTIGFRGQTLMVGFGWWGCAKLWYNVRYEAVA